MPEPRTRGRATVALGHAGILLLLATTLSAQEDSRGHDGLRHERAAAAAPLLIAASDRPRAAAIPSGLSWIQGAPPAGPKGRVTLVEFWDYTCLGCLRVLPLLEALHERYAPAGLVVIGVHTPDFEFSSNPALIDAAVKRLGIHFGVAGDPEMECWRAFGNIGWPAAFLIDAEGRLAWRSLGEEDYGRLERRIRSLLGETGADMPAAAGLTVDDTFAPDCGDVTPAIYLGSARGSLANEEGYAAGAVRTYMPRPIDPPEGQPLLTGSWDARADGVAAGPGAGSTLTLRYRARQVFAVLHPMSNGSHEVEVILDGAPLGPAVKGADVQIDTQGNSLVTVEASRLYLLAEHPRLEDHRLVIRTRDTQVRIAAFSFGDDCQQAPKRR